MSEDNTPAIDLEAFAKKVAEETAAKIAMKQAETKAAEEAEAKATAEEVEQKAAQEEQVKQTIRTGIETGAERLQADLEKEFSAKNADHAEIIAKYESDLQEKAAELEAMRNSKRDFSEVRKSGGSLESMKSDILGAHILGKITRKGIQDTDYAKELMQKAAMDITAITPSVSLDTIVSSAFEQEVLQEQQVAGLFREIAVASGSTVLPLNPDSEAAHFSTAGAADGAGFLEDNTNGTAATNNAFSVAQVVLSAHRLISGTNITNDTDEQTVVSVLPMIQNAMARAHARAKDKMCLFGATGVAAGLNGSNGAEQGGTPSAANVSALGGLAVTDFSHDTAAEILTSLEVTKARTQMGKYGVNPSDLAVIVGTSTYFELMQDTAFADVQQVGDLSIKVNGVVGSIYGMPVIVTDLYTRADNKTVFTIVNTRNYVIPRLRGVNIETDYSVVNQRTDLVASQSVGFQELVAGFTANNPSVQVIYDDKDD